MSDGNSHDEHAAATRPCSAHGTRYSAFCEECVSIGRSAAIRQPTPDEIRANRIRANRKLLDTLAVLWDQVPEQRFGQLVMNLSRDETGFADTWEWNHGHWFNRIQEAWSSWAS